MFVRLAIITFFAAIIAIIIAKTAKALDKIKNKKEEK